MKKMTFKVLMISSLLSLFTVQSIFAQRHFYNRLEIGSGNAWTFMTTEIVSMLLNDAFKSPMSEATLRMGVPSSERGNLYTVQGFSDYNKSRFVGNAKEENSNAVIGFSLNELLSNIIVGEKFGYISDRQGFLNFCLYGAAYYNLAQFKLMHNISDYTKLNTQRFQAGGGLMLILGSIEKSSRVIIDAGLRYNIPIYFSGESIQGSTNDILNKGVSSHYMVKYSMSSLIAVGFTFDMMHYNLFKDESLVGNSSKLTEFGITLSLLFR